MLPTEIHKMITAKERQYEMYDFESGRCVLRLVVLGSGIQPYKQIRPARRAHSLM